MREDAVGAGGLEEVGDEAGGDRDAGLVLLVAAAVGVVGDDGGDAAGGGARGGVDHDEQLHQAGVHGRCDGLDDEDVAGADVLQEVDEDVLVGELEDLALAEGHFEVVADVAGERAVGVAGEDFEVLVERRFCHRAVLTIERVMGGGSSGRLGCHEVRGIGSARVRGTR